VAGGWGQTLFSGAQRQDTREGEQCLLECREGTSWGIGVCLHTFVAGGEWLGGTGLCFKGGGHPPP